MLTWDEEDYLSKIPKDKMVLIKPYNKRIKEIAGEINRKISSAVPGLEIRHMGASALEISGQGDIDIYIFCHPKDFDKYIPSFVSVFGEPKSKKYDSIAWKLSKERYEVEIYLTDPSSKPMQRQIAIFEVLKNDKKLLDKYKKIKEELNGKSFIEYQKRKYEFYHQILDN